MRILRIITSTDPRIGGPLEGLLQSSRVLAERGHITEIACLDPPEALWLPASEYPVHALGPGRTSYQYSPRLIPWLRQNAARHDCIIVHGLWQYGGFATWRALRNQPLPYFVFPHGMLDPWFKHTYPLKHLKKSLYWPWGEYRVLRDATAVLFTCEEERLLARESFARYRCREVVVNYGTACPVGDPGGQRSAFLARFPELENKRLLLFLSRLHSKKGCDLLLKAFAAIRKDDPRLHLVMAGPDQVGWQKELEQMALRLGMASQVTWTGMLRGDLKWGAFRAAEAFVLPSHQENFGIAVVEALAVGLPVLISNKVNIWREIQQEEAGLVEDDTEEGTQRLLRHWLDLSPAKRKQMELQAQKCFLERFEINRAAQSLHDVLSASA